MASAATGASSPSAAADASSPSAAAGASSPPAATGVGTAALAPSSPPVVRTVSSKTSPLTRVLLWQPSRKGEKPDALMIPIRSYLNDADSRVLWDYNQYRSLRDGEYFALVEEASKIAADEPGAFIARACNGLGGE